MGADHVMQVCDALSGSFITVAECVCCDAPLRCDSLCLFVLRGKGDMWKGEVGVDMKVVEKKGIRRLYRGRDRAEGWKKKGGWGRRKKR